MTKQNSIVKILNENKCGSVIFFRPDELVMSIGYYPTLGASFCLYPSIGNPILFIPKLEPLTFTPKHCTIKRYSWGTLGINPWDELSHLMRLELEKLNLINEPITYIKNIGGSSPSASHGEGIPITLDILENLSNISTSKYKNISDKLITLYDIKSEGDVKKIEIVHEVTSVAINAFYKNLKDGITEGELAGIIELEIKKQMNLNEKKHVTGWCYIHSGKNTIYSGQYAKSSGKVIKERDVVLMELAICVNGYWSDTTRTGVVGESSIEIEKIFKIVKHAQNLAIDNMKPGIKMKTIDKIVREYIKSEGYEDYFQHALGHQVGFRYHDPGQGLNPDSSGILKPGMILTVEPGIYNPKFGFGIRIEDNILITKNGYKNLSGE